MKKVKLIVVSNRKLCLNENLENQLEKIFEAYHRSEILKNFEIVTLILRESDLKKSDYLKLFEKIYNLAKKHKIKINIHEYYNLADKKLDCGIHLKFNTFISLCDKKIDLGNYENVGVSVHSLEEAKVAESLGADYLIAGHIFHTECKKDLKPRGLEFLKNLSSEIKIPIFAIGGISEENGSMVVESGASGICMMSSLMSLSSKF